MTSDAAPRRTRRRLFILALLLLLIAGAVYGWMRWRQASTQAPRYIFATAQTSNFEDLVSATGSLQPRDYVDVGAQVSGQLKKIHVQVGQQVSEGDLLAEIDAETSIARVEASRASIRAQESTLVERRVNLEKADRDYQRQKNLMGAQATSTELLQNAESSLKAARAQINTLEAQIAQQRASMRVEESNLKFTRIYAPMSGTVASITARQGQTLNANQSAPIVLRITDEAVMTVQAQVSEADVSKLRPGMPVYFTTLGSQGRRWSSTLKKIEPTPTVTNNVVLYNALFEVPNPQRNLMTQMTAQVFFVVAQARDALLVPMAAVTLERGAGGAGGPRGPRGAGAGAGGPGTTGPAAMAPAPASAPAPANAPTADARPAGPRGNADAAGATANTPGAEGAPRRGPGGEASNGSAGPRGNWAQLSEEERERMRAERRAAREAGGGTAEGPRGEGPRPGGEPGATEMRAPRTGKVRVAKADGGIEDRAVTVGVSNRVQAQILSGLEAGERVVVGTQEAEGTGRRNANASGGMPGMGMGGGMPPGAGGPRR